MYSLFRFIWLSRERIVNQIPLDPTISPNHIYHKKPRRCHFLRSPPPPLASTSKREVLLSPQFHCRLAAKYKEDRPHLPLPTSHKYRFQHQSAFHRWVLQFFEEYRSELPCLRNGLLPFEKSRRRPATARCDDPGSGLACEGSPGRCQMRIRRNLQLRRLQFRHRRVLRSVSGTAESLGNDLLREAHRPGVGRETGDRLLG